MFLEQLALDEIRSANADPESVARGRTSYRSFLSDAGVFHDFTTRTRVSKMRQRPERTRLSFRGLSARRFDRVDTSHPS